ncbi:MAG TPA: ABC transporter permease [Polyangiaceae bacterium]|nr:ABC transporter permease [Polyangiaceae bacterium]
MNAARRAGAIVLRPLVRGLDAIGGYVELTGLALLGLVRRPFRFGQLLVHMEFLGFQSLFIIALTALFSGMVLALQTVHSLRNFGAESVVGSVVAVSLAREISPVFSALMVTARGGSSMAAELGNMRVTEQIDALTTMAVDPVQYLLSPRLLAAVLMLPLLCILYSAVGIAGAWLVAVEWLAVDPGAFLANIEKFLTPNDLWMGEVKATVFGFLISTLSCHQGFTTTGGARGVGLATTRAVVQSAVAILVANYLITSWMGDF